MTPGVLVAGDGAVQLGELFLDAHGVGHDVQEGVSLGETGPRPGAKPRRLDLVVGGHERRPQIELAVDVLEGMLEGRADRSERIRHRDPRCQAHPSWSDVVAITLSGR